ncbi:metallophosphoesterase [Marinobacterium marinum]|uniref:Metallophosphoesterase n=1 Tax=Marinobacterium marinum TaxID=2756129 RepID=A0A7W2AC65_9GAMM|nr:metallophosphoesterase [Marinobacterium marinum]MBA4501823.1 metallophosphoesterase [Marinobacterium marinum]
MRLRILSDLHLEHHDEGRALPDAPADVVILAGDIHTGTKGLHWAAARFPDTPVLYIPGNHEFYGTCMPKLRQALQYEAQQLGIELLDNRSIVLDGVQFMGTTLWTDLALYAQREAYSPAAIEHFAEHVMPDFRLIEQPEQEIFSARESTRLHQQALAWLTNELDQPFTGRRVVISHHAPLPDCIPPRYRGDDLSPVFASDLYLLMGRMDLWVHGHVHEPVDFFCAGTRVLANPGGYPGEFEPPVFVADRIVDLD